MDFNVIVLMVATFVLLVAASKVSSNEEGLFQATFPVKGSVIPPVKAPVPAPTLAPKPKLLPPVSKEACPGLCKVRCKANSMFDHCMRACSTCCDRCRCVPPGTFGNKEMCGTCYANMTTHGGRPKCP